MMSTDSGPDSTFDIPKFVVDLSMPPQSRYDHIIPHFQSQIEDCDLTTVFYDLLELLAGRILGKCLRVASHLALRRLHNAEESAELAGISKATSIPIHVLVAFNVLLDLLLGCTSGGVRTIDPTTDALDQKPRILHYRTLDWGMDQLRNIIVELDFVRYTGGPVVATTVGYLGYVGVLTGVRRGLSMSLNFRPYHSRKGFKQRFSFRWHQVMVVLGFRQSVSSVLRDVLLGTGLQQRSGRRKEKDGEANPHELDVSAVISDQATSSSTAAYIIFCTPDRVFIVEKDHRTALVRESDTFLTAYNHDAIDEENPKSQPEASGECTQTETAIGMSEIIKFSLDRKSHLDEMWQRRVAACQHLYETQSQAVTFPDVLLFVKHKKISNDETHYAVIMDPVDGKVIWRRAYDLMMSTYYPDDASDTDDGRSESVIE
ncbi:hypothetical protein BGZ63DRAFT_247059 [Mariannaea sp. PMI_226]|nr:hypothetical protein BGZ63DRAFT_247059 [Mariannaea sp. PMI_226]